MTTLILGGTGKTGRRVAQHVDQARIASRGTGFDLGDPSSWALDGVTAVYLVEPDLQAEPRLPRFVAEAVAAGARRLVLLSAPRAGEEGHPLYAAERAVRESGVGWTILHPNWFAQNFSEGPWRTSVLDGTLALPTGDGRTPFIDADDIAEVAVAALTEDRHSEQVYALTGPEATSFAEAIDLIAKATGRQIQYVDLAPDVFTQRQLDFSASPGAARLLTHILVSIANGDAEARTDHVERVLGRPPRSFEDYVAKAAAAGDWDADR